MRHEVEESGALNRTIFISFEIKFFSSTFSSLFLFYGPFSLSLALPSFYNSFLLCFFLSFFVWSSLFTYLLILWDLICFYYYWYSNDVSVPNAKLSQSFTLLFEEKIYCLFDCTTFTISQWLKPLTMLTRVKSQWSSKISMWIWEKKNFNEHWRW